jgi:hypothetical protein
MDMASQAIQEREGSYGPVEDHHTKTARVFSELTGIQIQPEDVSTFFIVDKLVRHQHTYTEDNLVDICGYAEMNRRMRAYRDKAWEGVPSKPEPIWPNEDEAGRVLSPPEQAIVDEKTFERQCRTTGCSD